VEHTGAALDPFPATLPLTSAGDLLLIPTPGHSYGHQSVLLRDSERSYFFAGDLAFSEEQLRNRGLQGIAQDLAQASITLDRTWRFVQSTPTVFLPSHDPDALGRLRDGATVSRETTG
jgi:glyoxylase-like metal-dependent hydrolase (beta-lactamase superfamily II)